MEGVIQVAAYCRVSTDHADQANSFASQKSYFQEYIKNQPTWELYNIYADEGISGTSTKKRTQFLKMIEDAREGRFQMILTKEISRFSRNILDTITYTRELKSVGVGVLFLTENLNTMDPESELFLTFMGTIAQEESRRTSQRVKWGQARQMEKGVVFGPSLLGYKVESGHLTIQPEEAELVRTIFHKYGNEKKGTSVICREMREEGYQTPTGNSRWSTGQIVKILKNEKYVGDLVQKKTITPNFLSHEKQKNRGEEELIVLRNHHEAIIDRTLWDNVQRELRNRNKHDPEVSGRSHRYAFSGKIRCGECGTVFVCRAKKRPDGSILRRWGCHKAVLEGSHCRETKDGERFGCNVGWLLRDDTAFEIVKRALNSLDFDHAELIGRTVELVRKAAHAEKPNVQGESAQVEREMVQLEEKRIKALDRCVCGEISGEELAELRIKYNERLELLQRKLEILRLQKERQLDLAEKCKAEMGRILRGEVESEIFAKTLVEEIRVYRARYVELKFCHFPHVFVFREKD